MGSLAPVARRVGIIGAGPAGVAFAKYLLAEKAFDHIDIWEQRDNVGGIWNLSPPTKSKQIPVPQISPRYGQGKNEREDEQSLEFESPLYDYLETNIPKGLMAFSEHSFSSDDPLFPPHARVLQYLEDYAVDVRDLVHLRHQVRDLRLDETMTAGSDVWRMEIEDLTTGQISVQLYSHVVVANGHFVVPSVPPIDGLEQWSKAFPGAVIHSKAYRRPEDYKDKKVLVIGNSASGLDIAHQVSQQAQKPVILSSRSVSTFARGPLSPSTRSVPQCLEFLPAPTHDRAVKFEDGTIEEGVDHVIFCTGYFYSIPFMKDFQPALITDGLRTQDVYKDLFHIHHPSLVLPVINQRVIPFPLAENQAAVVARVWSGRLHLPDLTEMREWEADQIALHGNGKYFHLKPFPEDCEQINALYQWAKEAPPNSDLENDGQGKLGSAYDQRMVWLRSQFPAIKGAYVARGDARQNVKMIEELGFDFDEWVANASEEDKQIFAAARCEAN